jgi:hypothetical protein
VNEIFDRLRGLQTDAGFDLKFAERDGAAQIYLKGFSVRINWYCRYINTLDEAELVITEWEGRPDFGSERYAHFHHLPTETAEHTFHCDILPDRALVWRDGRKRILSSRQVFSDERVPPLSQAVGACGGRIPGSPAWTLSSLS